MPSNCRAVLWCMGCPPCWCPQGGWLPWWPSALPQLISPGGTRCPPMQHRLQEPRQQWEQPQPCLGVSPDQTRTNRGTARAHMWSDGRRCCATGSSSDQLQNPPSDPHFFPSDALRFFGRLQYCRSSSEEPVCSRPLRCMSESAALVRSQWHH